MNIQALIMGVIFFIMALIGAIMGLLTSIAPFFLAHFLPALIILVCALMFFLWRGAGKGAKLALAVVSLILGLWLVINMAGQLVTPAAADMTGIVKAAFALYFGGVGGLIVLVGSIFGILSALGTAKQ